MKRICLAVTLCAVLSAPLCAADRMPGASAKLAPPQLSSIQALKSIRFPYAAVEVAKSLGALTVQADPAATTGGSTTPANPAAAQVYKTASGVTLRSHSLGDNATGSYAVVDYIQMSSPTLRDLQNHSDSAPLSVGIPMTTASTCAVFWNFASLPSGTHTYMLTLGATPGGTSASRMTINVGNQTFGPDKILYSNGAFRVLFTYDAGAPGNGNKIGCSTCIDCRQNSGSLDFYYVQLAQLD